MSLHFAKVLIARRATTFGKVDYLENQILLNKVCYVIRFTSAFKSELICNLFLFDYNIQNDKN